MTTTASALPTATNLICREHTFRTWDGVELFYRSWQPMSGASKALLLFHRGHEHSGRFDGFVKDLGLNGFSVFAWDARGHGRSPGVRGYADQFSDVVRDINSFVHHIRTKHCIAIEDMAILGHSVGAVAVAAWVHDYAPPIRAMVLATPAFRVKLYVPLAIPALRLRALLPKKAFVKSYVKASMLTHDPVETQQYANDPLISRNIAVNVLLDLYDTASRMMKDAGAIVASTLMMTAGSDWVVKNGPTRAFFEKLSSPLKRIKGYPGFSHAIFHETDRRRPIAAVSEFIAEAFERPAGQMPLLDADQRGYTRDEYEALRRPLPAWSPKRVSFAMQRFGMNTMCRLSKGVRVGWQSGFDSGESLDHVYRNRAEGITPLGKLIDRFYLNTIGWRGIRQRKTHLQQMLREAIIVVRATNTSVRILDIAAGPGRYLLEVLREPGNEDVTAILRDRSVSGLDAGRKIAAEMGVSNVRYESGDAFNVDSISTVNPRPNILIVSGLYELFPDNAILRESLRGIASIIEPGGWIIYTGQPWHPQVEMIARVLPNREGKPWVMRRRTQAEMDQLVGSVGFDKIDMKVDRWGIFSVSRARRLESR